MNAPTATAAPPPKTARVFTPREVAAILKTTPRTVLKLCRAGKLAHFTLAGPGSIRIPETALLAFIARETAPAVNIAHGKPVDPLWEFMWPHVETLLRLMVEKGAVEIKTAA